MKEGKSDFRILKKKKPLPDFFKKIQKLRDHNCYQKKELTILKILEGNKINRTLLILDT